MSGVITAAAAAVVSVGIGAYEVTQQAGVAKSAEAAQATQLGMEQTQFNEQQGYAKQLSDLMANPSSVTNLPGYSFNFDQGSKAVSAQMAAGGFLNSGNEATALTNFGQGMAMQTYNQQAQLLAGLAGFNAPAYGSNASSSGQVANTANANTFKSTGDLLASLGFMAKTGSFSFGGGSGAPSVATDFSGVPSSSAGSVLGANPFGGG